jgi:hypothetical protein
MRAGQRWFVQVHGIDFSGAESPAESVWLTTAEYDGQTLVVESVRSAAEAFDATGREAVMAGLREFLTGGDVSGLDVSFGLPRAILPAGIDSWQASLAWVRSMEYEDALAAQADWKGRARASDVDGVELKRATDRPVGASSPYSFITRHQTFHGLRDVVGPLVAEEAVSVQPMAPRADRPALIEIYPASTLRALELPDRTYKDDRNHPEGPAKRRQILAGLLEWGVELDEQARTRVLEDAGGDALDSLVAAVATAGAASDGFGVEPDRYDPLEGYIYS